MNPFENFYKPEIKPLYWEKFQWKEGLPQSFNGGEMVGKVVHGWFLIGGINRRKKESERHWHERKKSYREKCEVAREEYRKHLIFKTEAMFVH